MQNEDVLLAQGLLDGGETGFSVMNAVMTGMQFMLVFPPSASKEGQGLSLSSGQQTAEDSSFLECLLGAFSGVENTLANEGSSDLGKLHFISLVQEGMEWKSEQNQPEALQSEKAKVENSGRVSPEGALNKVRAILPTEADGLRDIKTIGKIIKGSEEANLDAREGTRETEGAAVRANESSALSEGGDKLGACEIRRGLESPPEVLRIPRTGAAPSSLPTLQKGQQSLLTKVTAPGSTDGGRVVDGEGVPQSLQDLAQKFYTGSVDPQTAKTFEVPSLPEPSTSEIGLRKGMRRISLVSEEVNTSQTTQPSVPGETVIVKTRSLPISLADGVMQQVMENLNLRTWRVGQKDLKIQLYPEEMGRLRMEIGLKEHQVVLKINVENPLVKDLIENNLAQLREGLLDQGLKMDRCSVTVGDHLQHQSGRNGDGSTESAGDSGPVNRGETHEVPSEGFHSPYHWESGLVNLFI